MDFYRYAGIPEPQTIVFAAPSFALFAQRTKDFSKSANSANRCKLCEQSEQTVRTHCANSVKGEKII